jgi:hypothetical protein
MSPLHRTERSERPVNPVRVVSGTATSRSNSRFAAETPGGASTDLSVPTTGAGKVYRKENRRDSQRMML